MDSRRLRPDERRRSLLRGRCPACGHASGEIVRDYWAEDALDDGWRVALRLVVQDGRVAVGEVRVIPDEPARRPPGEWSAEDLGYLARVPGDGITTRLIRKVSPTKLLAGLDLHDLVEQWDHAMRDLHVGDDLPRDAHVPFVERDLWGAVGRDYRRSTTGVSDLELARLAAEYVDLANDPATRRSPRKALAERREMNSNRVRDLLADARERRLLLSAGKRRPGGTLTPWARELLEDHDETEGPDDES